MFIKLNTEIIKVKDVNRIYIDGVRILADVQSKRAVKTITIRQCKTLETAKTELNEIYATLPQTKNILPEPKQLPVTFK